MQLEIGKAYKRRLAREKKRQEKIDLAPVQARMPQSRSIRYDNVKSAIAEEGIIALVIKDPSLLDKAGNLTAEHFSVPLFGSVFEQLRARHAQGLEVSLGVLTDLQPEEMSHITGICQKKQSVANETAFKDCLGILRNISQAKGISSDDDLMAFRDKLKERKGTKQ